MKINLSKITFLSSLLLAIVSAYCSILGFASVFTSAVVTVMIISGFIEFGRFILLYDIHHYWKKLKFQYRFIGTMMVIMGMLLSGISVYGFFTNAYSNKQGFVIPIQMEIRQLDNEISILQEKIDYNNNIIKSNNESLNNGQMNKILDVYVKKEYVTKALKMKSDLEKDQKQIIIENDSLKTEILSKQKEKMSKQIEMEQIAPTIAHLKYFSKLFGVDDETALIIFVIMIMSIFDLLSCFLLIVSDWIKEEEIIEEEQKDINYNENINEIKSKYQEIYDKINLNKQDSLKNKIKNIVEMVVKDKNIIKTPYFIKMVKNEPNILKNLKEILGEESSIIKEIEKEIKN